MSTVLNIAQTCTAGNRFSRRDWLQVGGLGMLGMSLPTLLRAEDGRRHGEATGRARSCIVVWLAGGRRSRICGT